MNVYLYQNNTEKVLKNIYIWEYVKPDYLCFTANTAGSTIKLNKEWNPTAVTLETSTDWESWSTYTFWNTITLSNIWDKIYFRNTSETDTWFSTGAGDYYQFVMTWSINWSWDINFLLNKNSTTTVSSYCYFRLFDYCTSLKTSPSLPATTLAYYCYWYMFEGSGITKTPALPATTLAEWCYYRMFTGCTSLTECTSIPATVVADSCCWAMFTGCTNLTTIPALPATTLVNGCYSDMFYWCSKIKISATQTWAYQTAYRIPTTWTWSSASYALYNMFYNTGWTYKSDPSINTTYYTSNTVV